jgi:hypothetical protein
VDSTTIHSQTVGSTIKHYCTIFSVRLWTVRPFTVRATVGSTNKHYCTIFSVRLWTVRPFTVRLISVQISINEQHLAPQNLLLAEPLTNGGRLVPLPQWLVPPLPTTIFWTSTRSKWNKKLNLKETKVQFFSLAHPLFKQKSPKNHHSTHPTIRQHKTFGTKSKLKTMTPFLLECKIVSFKYFKAERGNKQTTSFWKKRNVNRNGTEMVQGEGYILKELNRIEKLS